MESNIFRTLLYGDIFDYPMTRNELWNFLIANRKVTYNKFVQSLKSLNEILLVQDGYYALFNRAEIITIRKRRKKESVKKLQFAQKIAEILIRIPTIVFIGVSGSVAANNAEKDDDIDFFIITQNKTIWVTRLMVLILLQSLGIRRRRNQSRNLSNTICLNYLIDQTQLGVVRNKQDIYTAHEIIQLKPLVSRGKMFQKYLKANVWISDILPNALDYAQKQTYKKHNNTFTMFLPIFQFLEPIAKHFQMFYMKRHKTSEITTKALLAFYPIDFRNKILTEYKGKQKKYKTILEGIDKHS